jgi:glutathione S-transferase
MKLYYSHNLNPRVAVAVARHLGSPVEFILASPTSPAESEAFRHINPNIRVPVLVEDGQSLWETDAIACRLSALAGSDFWRTDAEMPVMMQWISWATHHLNRAADPLYFERVVRPTFSDTPVPDAELEEGLRNFRHYAAILDAHLEGRIWLLGECISYADFRTATTLPFADRAGLPLPEFTNVKRWHDRLLALEAWRAPFSGLA